MPCVKFSRNWREVEYHSKCCVTAAVAVRLVAQRLALTYGTGKCRVVVRLTAPGKGERSSMDSIGTSPVPKASETIPFG